MGDTRIPTIVRTSLPSGYRRVSVDYFYTFNNRQGRGGAMRDCVHGSCASRGRSSPEWWLNPARAPVIFLSILYARDWEGEMLSGAQFSPCRTYRYALWRTWDESLGHVMFIGLNPSTADETTDDPTIRRCIGFARAWGYGGIYMLNLFAYRSTDPAALKRVSLPTGEDNDKALAHYQACSRITIAAWGVHGTLNGRDKKVKRHLTGLHHLGLTKDGHPRHPLYLRADVKPAPFDCSPHKSLNEVTHE